MNTSATSSRVPSFPAVVCSAASEDATEADGVVWGKGAQLGAVFGLSGDLGAGKTTWVRGFARGLGYKGRVQSPSFGLIHIYQGGRFPLFHLDLYRLRSGFEIIQAGLESYLERPEGVSVVEWPERWWPEYSDTPTARDGWHRVWLRDAGAGFREIYHGNPGL